MIKFILLIQFLPAWLSGQITPVNLSELFFRNKPVLWQKTYQGVWDDVIPVRLELATDGTTCSGYFYFGENKNRFVVSGPIENDNLKLEEQDLHGHVTGYLALRFSSEGILGTWYNASRQFNARLDLMEGNQNLPLDYWVRSYSLKSDPTESLVIQQKEFSDQIKTRFYYHTLNKTLEGTCAIKDAANDFQVTPLTDYLHHDAGKLSTWQFRDKKLDIVFKLGSIEYSRTLDLIHQINMVQETYTDHWMAVDFVYPQTDKNGINQWFRKFIDSFQVLIQAKKDILLEQSEAGPESRMAFRLSIWPQIEYLNDQCISGIIQVKTSWDEELFSEAFTFDLKKGVKLEETDLFQDNTEFQLLKTELLEKELKKHQAGSGQDYGDLRVTDFKLITLKKEGLSFSSPFSILYGFRPLIIPYKDLKPYLNPKYFPL